MFDVLTGIAVLILACFVVFNWKRSGTTADSLKNLRNDDHTDNDLKLFKRKTRLEFQIMRNKIDDLERSRLSLPVKHESRPADIQPS